MTKFNLIGAGIIGGLACVITAIIVTARRDQGYMGDTDLIYIWAFFLGIIGFIIGGFVVGGFEKFKNETVEERQKRLKKLGLL